MFATCGFRMIRGRGGSSSGGDAGTDGGLTSGYIGAQVGSGRRASGPWLEGGRECVVSGGGRVVAVRWSSGGQVAAVPIAPSPSTPHYHGGRGATGGLSSVPPNPSPS